MACEGRGRGHGSAIISRGRVRGASNHQRLAVAWGRLSLTAPRGTSPADASASDGQALELCGETLLLSTRLWLFILAAPAGAWQHQVT